MEEKKKQGKREIHNMIFSAKYCWAKANKGLFNYPTLWYADSLKSGNIQIRSDHASVATL